jgi:hypothetical protein
MAPADTAPAAPAASAAVVLPHPPAPGRVGQGTVIEQSRAVAEVYAAVMIAREAPRNIQAAIRAMEQACQTPELADRAFYTQKRTGGPVTDASIHLARELVNCWGNVQTSVFELRRDDEHGQSEMQAVAWDLERNNRVSLGFIQPHMRDKDGGLVKLTSMGSIYESNANAGARRLRQCIFSVLPNWYVERAKALCRKTLNDGGGKPLPQRIAEALRLFEAEYNVGEADIARMLGKPADKWTAVDLGHLRVTYASLQQGTLTVGEAFPPEKLTDPADLAPTTPATTRPPAPAEPPAPTGPPVPAELPAATPPAGSAEPEPTEPAEPEPEPEAEPRAGTAAEPASGSAPKALMDKIRGQLDKVGVTAPDRAGVLGDILRRRVRSTTDLTTADAQRVAEFLNRATVADDPVHAFDALLDHHKETAP